MVNNQQKKLQLLDYNAENKKRIENNKEIW